MKYTADICFNVCIGTLHFQINNIKFAVYIGDTEGDEKAARFAGIPFIYAEYGFGNAVSPDAVITRIKQLPKCIKEKFI
jgi:phosphoglycolate phosphatase